MKVAELMQTNLKTISTDAPSRKRWTVFAVSGLSAVPRLIARWPGGGRHHRRATSSRPRMRARRRKSASGCRQHQGASKR